MLVISSSSFGTLYKSDIFTGFQRAKHLNTWRNCMKNCEFNQLGFLVNICLDLWWNKAKVDCRLLKDSGELSVKLLDRCLLRIQHFPIVASCMASPFTIYSENQISYMLCQIAYIEYKIFYTSYHISTLRYDIIYLISDIYYSRYHICSGIWDILYPI